MAESEQVEDCEKRLKIDTNSINHESIADLSDFNVEKILSNNTNRKTICVQGTFSGKDGVGIIFFEKVAFADNDLTNDSKYFSTDCTLRKDFANDIYGNYSYFPISELNSIKATVIHPATEKHILKYSIQNVYLVDESIDIYNTITLPFLEKEQFTLNWVYNILDHTSESERIVFEDPNPDSGFILLPDLKWDGKTLDTLYLLAIVHPKDIKSLRDLNGSHLPLLKNIFEKGSKAIKDTYGLNSSQLRIYIHYQPSFYHLHVHFTYLKHDAPGIFTEKSHMLSNVISNLTLLPDYYQKVTLPFVVRESEKLFETFVEKGILERKVNN